MIRTYIPKTAPENVDIKISIYVGRQGFVRSEVLKAKEWAPLQEHYVDPDAIKVVFEKVVKRDRKGKRMDNGEDWIQTIHLVPF